MKTQPQKSFLAALGIFIINVEAMPTFRGKVQALKALRRIQKLAVFQ